MKHTSPLLYQIHEAAEVLGGMSRSTIYERIAAGEITVVKVGRRMPFMPTDFAGMNGTNGGTNGDTHLEIPCPHRSHAPVLVGGRWTCDECEAVG